MKTSEKGKLEQGVRRGRERRRRRFLWGALLPLLVGGAMIGSIAVADVILSYQATSSVGANVNTNYYWQDGTNYAVAHADNFVTIACSGATLATPTTCGGTATPAGQSTETITLNGVQSAAVYDVQLTEFAVVAGFPAAGQTFNLGAVLATTTITGPTCVYVFITTVAPSAPASLSTAVPSNQPVGCGLFEPTVASGDEEDINLMTGAISNPATGQAGVTYIGAGGDFYLNQVPFGAATPLLYISMAVVSSATAPAGSATFFANPVVT